MGTNKNNILSPKLIVKMLSIYTYIYIYNTYLYIFIKIHHQCIILNKL